MSFQAGSSLSLLYFLAFFQTSYQKLHNLHVANILFISKQKKIIFEKTIILILILSSCNVILQNSRRNIIVSSFLLKIPFKVKNYKRNFLVISIN
jgi:hypothetical protein